MVLRFLLSAAVGTSLTEAFRTHDAERLGLNVSIPASNDDLPPCPCTIFASFCSRWDLFRGGKEIGTACVASEDAIITMHWMVQCVPKWKKSLAYKCPNHLPLKCDPWRVQDPCDTSMLGKCDKETCTGGRMSKKKSELPRFCHLSPCTEPECCDMCPPAKQDGDACVGEDGANLPQTCCEVHEDLDEFDGASMDCNQGLASLATPTTMRLGMYQNACGFNNGDVDTGASSFSLTKNGVVKMCDPKCVAVKDQLGKIPLNVLSDARELAAQCPDNLALQSQISPVGVFTAASVLDSTLEACAAGNIDIDSIRENRGSLGKLVE